MLRWARDSLSSTAGIVPIAIELIRCAWCGLELRDAVGADKDLEDLWSTRSITDDLLKGAIPVLRMALAMFRSQGLPASTESGLLARIEAHLGQTP